MYECTIWYRVYGFHLHSILVGLVMDIVEVLNK